MPAAIVDKIIISLATRYNKNIALVHCHFSKDWVEQWGRVQRLEGGDDMYASSLFHKVEDSCNATFVRVCKLLFICSTISIFNPQYDQLVDVNANRRALPAVFRSQKFYGQLQHILVVRLPALPALGEHHPTVLFLAAIRSCKLETQNSLRMPYYQAMGTLEVVDMTCLQCLVARIPENESQKRYALVDRSGNIARSFYVDNGDN